ncbi:MAG: PQQ-dependent sugar dehydrogenase [Pyrinomonadaceae bacterium]
MKLRIAGFAAVFALAGVLNIAFGQMPEIIREPFLTGLSSPVYITNAGDGTNRLFVLQQRGLILVVEPGSTIPSTFMNLTGTVSSSGSERGLLGLAFHPDFENNSYFFVNYTRASDGATVIARYKAINGNTTGDAASAVILLTIPQDFSNHNGGNIAFGPDNNLYIGMGDGGSANDPNNRAQNIESMLGKMLRITPNLNADVGNTPYTNPPDNPYVGVAGLDEIYAIGLRNPYRWSFDAGGNHDLWVADVGQNAIEEVDKVTLGGNYGWRVYEGNSCTNNDPGLCTPSNYIAPIFQYSHTASRCSITGGYVYRGTRRTFPTGSYIYADYCTGEYWLWDGTSQNLIENTPRNISAIGVDEAGEMYIVGLGGTVEKVVNTTVRPSVADFDGDGLTDLSVFRPDAGTWYSFFLGNSSVGSTTQGAVGDIPVPEDYDGDGKTDYAVYRPTTFEWFVLRSSDQTVDTRIFGQENVIPLPGDYTADDAVDYGFYNPAQGTWYVTNIPSGSNAGGFTIQQFGVSTDIPVPADYDGDGKKDIAVFRPSTGVWYNKNFDAFAFRAIKWGVETDRPIPGDFDGDGMTDINIFRPSEGNWYAYLSSTSQLQVLNWGLDTDIQVAGDYDGDGTDDTAIWRPSTGEWYVLRSSNFSYFAAPFGTNGDLPAPAYQTR